jgi:hypothetical protein
MPMRFQLTSSALAVLASAILSAPQYTVNHVGLVEDWSTHHLVFSNPGTFEDAVRSGRFEEWQRIVTDPRYRMQQVRRGMVSGVDSLESAHDLSPPGWLGILYGQKGHIHRDWQVALAGGAGNGVGTDRYPAKYSFSPIGAPNCTSDYVVFGINTPGLSNQANIMGVNNLYKISCTGTVPTILFSYLVGSGSVLTDPVLSLDGTKVAFIESKTGGSIFHVLTLDQRGNSGCPNSPCNGTAFNSPATPGVNNNAIDKKITMSGGVSVTRSAPFVDYSGDIAYTGDDSGKLHKFTGIFRGTPAEAGSPWPVTVASGVAMTSPVFDHGASQHILIGGNDGNLYCLTIAGVACSTFKITLGASIAFTGPIVDSTMQTVFAEANTASNAVLIQATTSLGSPVSATMGVTGTDLFDGAFDNAYFTNVSTGHMYFCGNLTTAATPTLWRVTFNSSGVMSSTNDGGKFQLVQNGNTGTNFDCTPLTEVYNTSQSKDYLFIGVKSGGFVSGTPNCGGNTCLISFVLPTTSPFTFPTSANATFAGNVGPSGISGIIVDNVSGVAGASQVYFGSLQNNAGVQASQSSLQ